MQYQDRRSEVTERDPKYFCLFFHLRNECKAVSSEAIQKPD